MVQFAIQTHVAATPKKTWGVIRDFGNVANYADGLKASRQTTEGDVCVGAERICDFHKPMMGKSQLHERVTEFDDKAMVLGVDILGGMGPFKTMRGTFRLQKEGKGTLITFEQVADGGLMAKLMGGMAKGKLRKELTGFLDDVKTYVESQ
ncbi:MAG: SRPBCC family protein [Thermoplasmatota archaeon]